MNSLAACGMKVCKTRLWSAFKEQIFITKRKMKKVSKYKSIQSGSLLSIRHTEGCGLCWWVGKCCCWPYHAQRSAHNLLRNVRPTSKTKVMLWRWGNWWWWRHNERWTCWATSYPQRYIAVNWRNITSVTLSYLSYYLVVSLLLDLLRFILYSLKLYTEIHK